MREHIDGVVPHSSNVDVNKPWYPGSPFLVVPGRSALAVARAIALRHLGRAFSLSCHRLLNRYYCPRPTPLRTDAGRAATGIAARNYLGAATSGMRAS